MPLDNNQLTSLPPEIGSLINLRYLRLSGNQLTSLPSEIGSLTELGDIQIKNNELTSVPPEIAGFPELYVLYLDGNSIVGDITTSLLPHVGENIALQLSDGVGVGNGCLTVTDSGLRTWLNSADPAWNEECV